MPFQRVTNAWLQRTLRLAQPTPASTMSRLEIVMHARQHWVRGLLGLFWMVVVIFTIAWSWSLRSVAATSTCKAPVMVAPPVCPLALIQHRFFRAHHRCGQLGGSHVASRRCWSCCRACRMVDAEPLVLWLHLRRVLWALGRVAVLWPWRRRPSGRVSSPCLSRRCPSSPCLLQAPVSLPGRTGCDAAAGLA